MDTRPYIFAIFPEEQSANNTFYVPGSTEINLQIYLKYDISNNVCGTVETCDECESLKGTKTYYTISKNDFTVVWRKSSTSVSPWYSHPWKHTNVIFTSFTNLSWPSIAQIFPSWKPIKQKQTVWGKGNVNNSYKTVHWDMEEQVPNDTCMLILTGPAFSFWTFLLPNDPKMVLTDSGDGQIE